MKAAFAARLANIFAAVLILAGVLAPASALADAKPYFKVTGGDVFSGGWFKDQNTSCSTTDANYQAPTFNPTNNQYAGGILAYATSNRKGSSVDFGALALGLIQGDPANTYGFYSGLTTAGSGISSLNFSGTNNVTGNYWGGYFAGATPQIHCIPDYYGTKIQGTPASYPSPANVGSLSSGQYVTTAGSTTDITPGGATVVAAGKNITVFAPASSNIYISHNITYAAGYTADNVPKLAIISKGNIFIAPTVTQLEGVYIAQPDTTSSATTNTTGNIWTCHDGTTADPDGNYVHANCGSKLTVNGALIAKQINLVRINGDIAAGDGNSNPAEVINFTPAMVLGGPFFNQQSSSTGLTVNSVVSLPPVF